MTKDRRNIQISGDARQSIILTGDNNSVVVKESFRQKIEEPVQETGPDLPVEIGPNPYKGLSVFQESDTDRFFGRETVVEKLWQKFSAFYQPWSEPTETLRLLAVLGPSGSGKSSVVRAGLIPELARQKLGDKRRFHVAVFRPQSRPIEHLAEVLARFKDPGPECMAWERRFKKEMLESGEWDGLRRCANQLGTADNEPLVIVIDQFEELYTLCTDENEQEAFIENLLHAASDPGGQVSVVMTLRSDFLIRTQQHTDLSRGIAACHEIVPAMSRDELKQAIARPAADAGHPIDDATAALLLEQSEGRDGVLPLLEFALEQIWNGLPDKMPADTLREINGVGGALAGKAQEIFDRLKDEDEKALVRRAFLKMVKLGEGVKDTRKRVAVADLVPHGSTAENVLAVLRKYAHSSARLVTLLAEQGALPGEKDACESKEEPEAAPAPARLMAEITHEALFEHWEAFGEWLADSRDDIRFEEKLTQAARDWQAGKGGLWYEPPQLNLLVQHHEKHDPEMTQLQREFYNASVLKHEEKAAKEKRRQRNLRLLVILLAVLLLGASGAAFMAFRAEKKAQDALNRAERQRELALESSKLMTWDVMEALAEIPGTRPYLTAILSANADLLEKIYSLNPDTPDAQRDRAANLLNSSDHLFILGDIDRAFPLCLQANEILRNLAESDLTNTQAQRDLSVSHNKLGDLYLRLGQTDEALKAYEQDLEISRKLAESDPTNTQAQRDLLVSYYTMGTFYKELGNVKKASEEFEKALEIAERLAKNDPRNAQAQNDLKVLKKIVLDIKTP